MTPLGTRWSRDRPDIDVADLERENQVLKQRLAALANEAANNDAILARSLAREMDLLEAETLEDLMDVLVHGLAESYCLELVTLALLDRDHEIRHLLLSQGIALSSIPQVFFVDSPNAFSPRITSSSKPWLGPFDDTDHRLVPKDVENISSVALIPLHRHNRLIGSLNFGSADRTRYTRQHATDFLHRLGAIAAFCLENAINRSRLIQTGLTDVLTGWYNRRYLEDRLHGELARAQRNQSPMVCLLLDIDHFKRVNDSCGHLAGDSVLREITRRVAGEVRASDVAARFGGDELAVLLPNTSTEEAKHLAERIRRTVAQPDIQVRGGSRMSFTLCVGISGIVPRQGETNMEELGKQLLERADKALYRAKSLGRNRVELYNARFDE